jgi:hypothetical protein
MAKSTDQQIAEFGEDITWHEHDLPKGGSDRSLGRGMKQGKAVADSWNAAAAAVREHVRGVVRQSPQVMVKITGSSSDMKGLARSLDYVARGGKYKKKGEKELAVENENGDVFVGVDGRELLRREWALGGPPIPENAITAGVIDGKKPPREVLKIIYSMPADVGREAVSAAARAAVAETFKNHQWVIAHHADTDNQHTHVLVKMVDMDGKRMNPRKGDLETWRKVFARELNARGIEAVSTRRRVRMERSKGVKQAVREMRKREIVPDRDKFMGPSRATLVASQNEQKMLKAYTGIAQALAESKDPQDRQLSQQLQDRLAQQGHTIKLRMGGAAPKPSM